VLHHVLGFAAATTLAAAGVSAWEAPATLRDTGLYSDWSAKTVDRRNLPFTPQYPLWSDGAAKARWIQIPAGRFIDASDADSWEFPVGTKLWKEFRIGGRRVETRYIESTPEGWQFAVYLWSDDESEAPLAPERGTRVRAEVAPGVRHVIPSRYDCRACHEGRPVPVLGFTALQLSPDRDPNAPHAERKGRDHVDLRDLVDRGLVRGLAPYLLHNPPRIPARTATERAALGYLYGNCAMCHNGRGSLASLGFSLDSPAARRTGDADALLTAVSRASHFTVPGAAGGRSERVRPGAPEASAVAVRMGSRRAALQMPPLGTQLVDEEAMRLVGRWIAEDLGGRAVARAESVEREKETKR
jgi:mono/diheme cytochrome c family protein